MKIQIFKILLLYLIIILVSYSCQFQLDKNMKKRFCCCFSSQVENKYPKKEDNIELLDNKKKNISNYDYENNNIPNKPIPKIDYSNKINSKNSYQVSRIEDERLLPFDELESKREEIIFKNCKLIKSLIKIPILQRYYQYKFYESKTLNNIFNAKSLIKFSYANNFTKEEKIINCIFSYYYEFEMCNFKKIIAIQEIDLVNKELVYYNKNTLNFGEIDKKTLKTEDFYYGNNNLLIDFEKTMISKCYYYIDSYKNEIKFYKEDGDQDDIFWLLKLQWAYTNINKELRYTKEFENIILSFGINLKDSYNIRTIESLLCQYR